MIIQHLFIKIIFYRMMVYKVILKCPWLALAKHLMFKRACSILLLLLLWGDFCKKREKPSISKNMILGWKHDSATTKEYCFSQRPTLLLTTMSQFIHSCQSFQLHGIWHHLRISTGCYTHWHTVFILTETQTCVHK